MNPVHRAIVLAAGRGERMRPLTDTCPKPLLPLRGRPMLWWHLEALAEAGVHEVVVNTAWLEAQFEPVLREAGAALGLEIHWSREGRDHGGALETAGGIATALPWLGERFWVVSGDIFAPAFAYDAAAAAAFAAGDDDAHLWLVPNPDFHPRGDFTLDAPAAGAPSNAAGRVRRPADADARPLTYANLALVHRRLVDGVAAGTRAPLGPLLFAAADAGRLGGRLWTGEWHNLGTPAQWQALAEPAAQARR